MLRISSSLAPYANGESIAVNGACLSVVSSDGPHFNVFASAETLEKTRLGQLAPGTSVNLERAMTLSDPLGGHLVTGHVDARVSLLQRSRDNRAGRFVFSLPADPVLRSQIAPKGSVALDGVSLTVNTVTDHSFEVMIIPLTAEQTTLGRLSDGDEVHLETDLIAKYVARMLDREHPGAGTSITLELLANSGFVR